jgi:hypothetical protein
MAGLVPAIPVMKPQRPADRDRRDKPGDNAYEYYRTWNFTSLDGGR